MAAVQVKVTSKKVLDRARSQIGVHEIPSNSNRTPYSVWYGVIGPWCAMFVSWCFFFAGAPLPISTSKGFAYCPYGVDWFKKKGAWATKATRPKPGWIVFFDFPNDGIGRPSHTGLVEGVASDGRIITIEGNTNGAGSRTGGNVMRHYRSVGSGIIGYGMVSYASAALSHPVLKLGSKGAAVKELQMKLNKVSGAGLTVDGDFGGRTDVAVRNFQRFFGLPPDGVVGPKTWGTLDYIYAIKK
jgi:hypothetical protein